MLRFSWGMTMISSAGRPRFWRRFQMIVYGGAILVVFYSSSCSSFSNRKNCADDLRSDRTSLPRLEFLLLGLGIGLLARAA